MESDAAGDIDALCDLFDAPQGNAEEPALGNVESVEELLGLFPKPREEIGGSASSSSYPRRPAEKAAMALDRRRMTEASSTGIVGAETAVEEALEPDLPEPSEALPPEVVAKVFVISAHFDLCVEVDVKNVAFGLRHAEYNPRKHGSITVRLREPRTTALIRPSGKVSVVGACDEDLIKLSAKKVARLVQKCGHEDAKFADFKVTNLYARANVNFPVRLDKLAMKWRRHALYEPETYSGCVFKTRKPKCTYLVTSGGKVMIGGCKTVALVAECLQRIYPVLQEFSS